MTRGMRLRRLARRRGARRETARAEWSSRRRAVKNDAPTAGRSFYQAMVCGVVFSLLVLLKLIMPENLSALRGTLAHWLVRDADFAEAFSVVGQAVTEPRRFAESLGNAYVAVFGAEDARKVSGEVEVASPSERADGAEELPDYASAEQPELTFAHAAPLEGTMTSSFGWRDDPNSGARAFHSGVDLAADEGTAILSFADGTVGVVGESTVLGKYLTVQHTEGYETVYAHCSRITASSGQSVTRGEKLAEVGATGNATGAHLHFELLSGSKYIDPIRYITDVA